MVQPAERMRALRERRQTRDVRELRMLIPDARSQAVRERVEEQSTRLSRLSEDEAIRWIEAVSEFDNPVGPHATLRRGDIVVVSAPGDFGKPRPAVVVQSDAIPDAHGSVILCQMTSDLSDAADFRIDVEPTVANGLKLRSQIMVDKPVTVRRERVGALVGALEAAVVRRLNTAIALVMGLADR